MPDAEQKLRHIAIRLAEEMVVEYEQRYTGDRPRRALALARRLADGQVSTEELYEFDRESWADDRPGDREQQELENRICDCLATDASDALHFCVRYKRVDHMLEQLAAL